MSVPGASNPLLLSSAAGAAGYEIERSLRFNSADSAYLNRTPSTAGNRQTWTWAGWMKKQNSGYVFSAYQDVSNYTFLSFSGDKIRFGKTSGGSASYVRTSAVYRDVSAWYHFVIALDTTQTTGSDRIKIYVNGVLFDNADYDVTWTPSQNEQLLFNTTNVHTLGNYYGSVSSNGLDGYLADVHFIDGQQLEATDFGEFDDNGVWQPIEYTGSYNVGVGAINGFYLSFSDNSSASALGTDDSGNGNDWTVNNISAPVTDITLRPRSTTTWTATGGMATHSYFQSPANKTDSNFGYNATLNWNTSGVTTGGTMQLDFATVLATAGDVVDVFQGNPTFETPKLILDNSANLFPDSSTTSSDTNFKYSTFTIPAGRTCSIVFTTTTSGARSSFFGVMVNGVSILTDDINVGNDSLLDSPTNGDTANDTGLGGELAGNYATWNPLIKAVGSTSNTYANGNLDGTITNASVGSGVILSNFGMPSGKWYWETVITSASAFNIDVGIVENGTTDSIVNSNVSLGQVANGYSYYANDGNVYNNDSGTAYGATYVSGDVIGVAFDADTGKLWFSKNGTWQASGDPAAGTNAAFSSISTGKAYVAGWGITSGSTSSRSYTGVFNAGQRPFAYSAPSGFKALCTANLDTSLIEDGSTAMDVATDTGANILTSTKALCGGSANFLWIKDRDNGSTNHHLIDIVRDPDLDGTPFLASNSQSDEATLGTYVPPSGNSVGWGWYAGSSTVTNNDGSISAQVRANPAAGFSIVSYTGNGIADSTVGHGLNVAPLMFIIKNRDVTSNWPVFYTFVDGSLDILQLWTDGTASNSARAVPTSSVFTIAGNVDVNTLGNDYIAYCFAPVDGYSAFGTYTGNNLADGPFIYTGFRPKWILIKCTDFAGQDWALLDSVRNTYNVANAKLWPNLSDSEVVNANNTVDFLANGFKLRATNDPTNGSHNYIYAAFAENPFKTARAR